MVYSWIRDYKWSSQWPLYAACFFFAAMALAVKLVTAPGAAAAWLGDHSLPPIQVVFFRSSLCLVLVLPLLLRDLKRYPITRDKIMPLALRSLAGGLAMVAYFQAIARLPLATAVLLNYTSPIWAGLFAWIFLAEGLSAGVVLAYPLAVTGVLLVLGAPAVGGDYVGVLLGLASAVMAGGAYTALRGLKGTPPSIVVTGLCIVSSLVAAPSCYANYVPPSNTEWTLLWICAAASAAAQILLTLGYRTSSCASASTVGLATVAVSGVMSAVVLADSLDLSQWAGITVLLWATSQTSKRSTLARLVRTLWVSWRRPAPAR